MSVSEPRCWSSQERASSPLTDCRHSSGLHVGHFVAILIRPLTRLVNVATRTISQKTVRVVQAHTADRGWVAFAASHTFVTAEQVEAHVG